MHRASAGNKIDKEEYTTVFKKMFKNLGLPVEMVDKFDFEYSPSVSSLLSISDLILQIELL